ncbi:MAG: hypothetical protein HUU47_06390 [Bacteroidetes bacterium]|nr:hypothetical protein [Bacteroidota bacterium]
MKKILFSLIFAILIKYASAQGCSDAGLCTAGGLKPIFFTNDSLKSSLNFSLNFSIGENGTNIITPQFEPLVKVNENSFIQFKIPYLIINGNLGSSKGISDVSINYNYKFDSLIKYKLYLTCGVKIASGSASLKTDGICLPMTYQTSMGTTDFLGGLSLEIAKGLSVSLGLQVPMFNINQNKFDSAAFLYFKNEKKINDNQNYFISSKLKRKSDVMMRIDKTFAFKKNNISIGILPIYHLGKDKVNTTSLNNVLLSGSQGLTLNFNTSLNYKISDKSAVNFILAFPLITRKSRPDGLGRSIVTGISYKYVL